MNAFLVSLGMVTLAEMGDKTQLLSLVLSTKYKKPIPIILGILLATILNHAFAGAIGAWLMQSIGEKTLAWILGASFILMGFWTLIPDKLDEADQKSSRFGVFATTLVAFFFAEMGDKTQVATIGLVAQLQSFYPVVLGTIIGMMIANVPIVLLGDKIAKKIPLKTIHFISAILFFTLGALSIFTKAL